MQKQFSPAEKAAILKEHFFIKNQSITTILAKYNISQTRAYPMDGGESSLLIFFEPGLH